MRWGDILDALGAARYAQHAICLTNDPILMTLYIAADLITAVAYFTIGTVLIILRAKLSLFRPGTVTLYGSFIFLCGLNHLSGVAVLFAGVYRLDVAIKAAMAGVSIVTAWFTIIDAHDRIERRRRAERLAS